MNEMPRLLKGFREPPLPRALLTDLRLDRIVSEAALAVLARPCDPAELPRRWELFALLENESLRGRVEQALAALVALDRAIGLCREAKTALSRYHLYADVPKAYLAAAAALASLSDGGALLGEAAAWFTSEEQERLHASLREAISRVRSRLDCFHVGLLSCSDKIWLTPDCASIGEFERIADTIGRLGLGGVAPKRLNIKADPTLSEALCRLYAAEVSEIEQIMETYPIASFRAVTDYIPELRFFLEIAALAARAAALGVPHITPTVAESPQYLARDAYDLSLLAKNCDCIIPNDISLTEDAPFFFLTGANGGGKTTYLRAVGLNLIFFLSGCPVFAREACIYPFARVAAHFPADERFDGVGRLDEERRRAEEMLESAEGETALLLFNETYSGADDQRGFALLCETVDRLCGAGHFGIYVTHFHEVMTTAYPVLSAEIDPTDENRRTYRIVQSKGTASSYAADILRKYRLDRESLRERREQHGR